jgi:hypothetical protein
LHYLKKCVTIHITIKLNKRKGHCMLKITNTTTEKDGTFGTNTNYTVEGSVALALDSIWDYDGKVDVDVTNIQVYTHMEDDGTDSNVDVNVTHNADWNIYTDTGFESAISNLLNMDVQFTEQGMQEDGHASMEV